MANPPDQAPLAPPQDSSPGAARPRRGPFGRAAIFLLRGIYGGLRALVTVPLTVGTLYIGWLVLVYAWHYNYSSGTRTGIVRKVSHKGSPVCKYVSVELAVLGNSGNGQLPLAPEVWEVTVDDDRPEAPLRKALEAAERSQKPTTIRYRQDKKRLPWRWCVDTEYHAVAVE